MQKKIAATVMVLIAISAILAYACVQQNLTINDINGKYEKYQSLLEQTEKETAELNQTIQNLENEKAQLVQDLADMLEENQQLDQTIELLRGNIEQLDIDIEDLENEKAQLVQDLADMLEENQQLKLDINSLNAKVEELQKKIDDLQKVDLLVEVVHEHIIKPWWDILGSDTHVITVKLINFGTQRANNIQIYLEFVQEGNNRLEYHQNIGDLDGRSRTEKRYEYQFNGKATLEWTYSND